MICVERDLSICGAYSLIARTQFMPPAQLPCFFAAEMQKIEKAAGALDVVEDVTNVGAAQGEGG